MIRYSIRPSRWLRAVEEAAPGWLARAQARTDGFRALGRYEESSAIWSQVKRAYMELQGFKCGFCERRLEKSAYGNVEHDVEHFRPKRRIRAWPTGAIRRDRGADFAFGLGAAADPGYFLLAYHIENYLIACKTCNTALKSDYFPVAAANRQTDGDTPRSMGGEKPYLIYPIGAVDTDPERLITFEGILPVPVGSRGHKRRRAEVTIRFFELDTREVLLEERAETLLALHVAMASLGHPDDGTRAAAGLLVNRLIDIRSPHASCARRHHDLVLADPARAGSIARAALDYLLSLQA